MKSKSYLILIICIIMFFINKDRVTELVNAETSNSNVIIFRTDSDYGFSKMSSVIVASQDKNYLTLNDKVNNYTDLLLNVDGEVFTCKVLASTDTDALAKEYESIVKNNPSDVETFLDELMNEGVIAFYMTGIPQKRSIEDDFEQFEDETGTVLRLK